MAEAKEAKKKVVKAKSTVKKSEKPLTKKATKSTVVEEVHNGAIQESTETTNASSDARQEEVKTAKAGKRSAKAIAEVEEKQAKEERKAKTAEKASEETPKVQQKPARTRLERRSKNYRKVAEQIEKDKMYSLVDALTLATKTNPVKFDATVELHLRLSVDPRQADQNLRNTVVLPAGTGKTVRVAVFADAAGVATAKKAGADVAAADEFLQQLEKGTIDFDILISTPQNMAKLGKYARLLGPKGLMPNPKSGTVTTDINKAVSEAKAGRVEYRVDSTGIVHVGVGKVSFGPEKLRQNADAIVASIKQSKPNSIKGAYVKSVFVTTTMGPSIPVSSSEI